ncbi:MAG: hypothetical protein KJO67_08560, partial [Silicimonas sp.]|nr:hypothetical protein [Silicimonas sp.]
PGTIRKDLHGCACHEASLSTRPSSARTATNPFYEGREKEFRERLREANEIAALPHARFGFAMVQHIVWQC